MFSISFTPVEYGKEKQGKLLIYTDEMLWSYMFKGTFPLYKVPKQIKKQVDNQLDHSLL